MLRFAVSRIVQGVFILWGIVTLLFVIFYTLDDPIEYLVEDNADTATRQAIRQKYGLDRPLPVRYVQYINRLSPLGIDTDGAFGFKSPDLGISFQTGRRVGEMLFERLEGTAILAFTALGFAALVGILLGLIAALKHDSFWDNVILGGSVLGVSAPSFFVGVLVAWLFAVKWQAWTGLEPVGYMFEENVFQPGRYLVLKRLWLPALALGVRPLAIIIQLTRSSLLDVLSANYIRTARAKGLRARRVLLRHALRNALNPVLTSVTGWLASLLAGAFFIEYIFNWQGLGKLTIDALNTQDLPVILGSALLIGLIFIVISIITDLLYAVLDPRVKR